MAWAPDYATTAEFKRYTRIKDISTLDDAEIALALTAASRAVDVHTNRQFGVISVAAQRFYTGRWDRRIRRWMVEIDDLMTVTSFAAITVDSEGVTVGTVDSSVLEPRNAAAKGRPWTRMLIRPNSTYKPSGARDEVAVTALWGWTAVPDAIKQATLLQANRFLSRRNSPYGVAGSPDLGNELRLLSRVDPDVAVILSPYVRWWGAA